ncbi:MAG: NAD(P)-dependent oxidoreductase [Prolixibacteraceae bacterium]|jgi:D-3-phosphoglycerate dehydrogenase|nr:NAD(P)-dependent oxidoreductase [Prolixibacteraceae bacterium]
MTKVLIATEKPFAQAAVARICEIIESSGFEVVKLEKYSKKSELLDAAGDVDGMIVRSDIIDREVLEAARKLKIVVRAGAGYDNIDITVASAKGVCVMNTPGQNSNAVAELAIGLALYGVRDFFSGNTGGELRGRTIGLHGYGYVARNVKRIARAFGMEPIVYTRYSRAQAVSEGIEVTGSLEELYERSDIVSIHVPARGEHIKSVNMDILARLKQGAILVNTARKEVIDEDDLCRFMEVREDVKYLSDIEPDCKTVFDEKFAGRYYFTPKKLGAQTEEANMNAGIAAAEQIVAFILNGNETFRVNKR